MELDVDVEKIVMQQIAASVLEKLTPESRDAIMRKAVVEALGSYSYRSAVEKAVCDESAKIATEMLQEPQWQGLIRSSVREALQATTAKICEAMPEAMLRLFGKDEGTNSYDRGPGLLHKILSDKLKVGGK